jgi:hypothetical protein
MGFLNSHAADNSRLNEMVLVVIEPVVVAENSLW